MLFLRLYLETIIRVRWLATDEDHGVRDGELVVDESTVVERVRRLRKRDLLNLEAAYIAINAATRREGEHVGALADLTRLRFIWTARGLVAADRSHPWLRAPRARDPGRGGSSRVRVRTGREPLRWRPLGPVPSHSSHPDSS